VSKVIDETSKRLKILSLLNTEFFEEIKRVDESDLMNTFGSRVGKLLFNHAILEEKF